MAGLPFLFPKVEKMDTYWGSIDTVRASTGLALKRMSMMPGLQSSMEHHVIKREVYFVVEGSLQINFLKGRGVRDTLVLDAGSAIEIPPGVDHQRIARTKCVIWEAASYDDESDTYFVEDGRL